MKKKRNEQKKEEKEERKKKKQSKITSTPHSHNSKLRKIIIRTIRRERQKLREKKEH